MSTADAPERAIPNIPGPTARLLCIQAPYYESVVAGMRQGAIDMARRARASVETIDVAGAFELPAALRMAIQAGRTGDGVLILGCVIQGGTDHYEHICRETFRGIMDISVETGMPIGFGLLTVATLEQAQARAADDRHNKGREAMYALLTQVALRRQWALK
ncbi:MAG: 6,7-dimethyl-8-ribityllumazine synthase [Rubritepida sp.]|nr:6,7-dimethyl-8-ribityllumazine synthase [Rubritepida sp.]